LVATTQTFESNLCVCVHIQGNMAGTWPRVFKIIANLSIGEGGRFSSDILIILVICNSNQTECVFVKAQSRLIFHWNVYAWLLGFSHLYAEFLHKMFSKENFENNLHFLFGFACLCVLLSFFLISFKFSHHFYFYLYVELNKDHGWDFPLLLAWWQKLSTLVNFTWHWFAPNCQELLKKSVKMLWQLVTTILTCCWWRSLNIYVVLLLLFTPLLNFRVFFFLWFFQHLRYFLFSLFVCCMWCASNLSYIRSFCHFSILFSPLFRLQVRINSQ